LHEEKSKYFDQMGQRAQPERERDVVKSKAAATENNCGVSKGARLAALGKHSGEKHALTCCQSEGEQDQPRSVETKALGQSSL
jgi:hypothetical protein